MAATLLVRVLDVFGSAVDAQRVSAVFGGALGQQLRRTSAKGAFEIEVPPTVTRVAIVVEHPGFFDAVQNMTLTQTGTPTLAFDGAQALNVRNLHNHSRDGGGFNVEVFVVLGQLRDASGIVDGVKANPGPGRRALIVQPAPRDVVDFDGPILTPVDNPAGAPPAKSQLLTASPRGKLFFAERTTPPRLIAIYDPVKKFPFVDNKNEGSPQAVPINYHLFFHPNIPATFTDPYPNSFSYIDLLDRYMLQPHKWDIGKAMVPQHTAAGEKCVFIFPVGGKTESFGNLNSQASVLRLLAEVNYFIQRMDGVPFPLQPVGDLALSGFSAGIRLVSSVLTQGRVERFNNRILRDVYCFDGVFATRDKSGKEIVDTPSTLAFCAALRGWFRGGDQGRSLRVYSQSSIWLDQLKDAAPGTTIRNGRDGAREADSARSTILFTPSAFWDKAPAVIRDIAVSPNPTELFKSVHQFIPAFFMEHALKRSAMAPGATR